MNVQEGLNMDDIFSMFNDIGMGAQRDLQTKLQLSFFEAATGCKKDVTVEYMVAVSGGTRGRPQRERKRKTVFIRDAPR